MRIAISGTHLTGKSSLVDALGVRLANHTTIPEPYELLEERGYRFDYPPSIDDFVVQLKQSLTVLRRRSPNVIIDRCPLDFIAYIYAGGGEDRFDVEDWRKPIAAALGSLDLLVAVRIDPAHDPVGVVEDAAYRAEVDSILWDIIEGDSLDLCADLEILPLGGPWDRRIEAVMAYVTGMRRRR